MHGQVSGSIIGVLSELHGALGGGQAQDLQDAVHPDQGLVVVPGEQEESEAALPTLLSADQHAVWANKL